MMEVSDNGHLAHETKMQDQQVMQTFEAFKPANDERLGEIERKQRADVLLEEKVERLNRYKSCFCHKI